MVFKRVDSKKMYISNCGNVLKSYDKIIVIKKGGEIYLNADYYDFSTTTSRHRNQFLGVNAKEFNENMKKGRYNFLSDEEMMKMCYMEG